MTTCKNFLFTILLVALILSAGNHNAFAQLSAIHDFTRADSVPVLNETEDTLNFPFAGGLNSCQFMNLDIDLDGNDDLLVFDRHGNRLMPFLVSGASPVKYNFAPSLAFQFPPLEQWMQAIDYNNDGKKDIFTYTTGGIKVYRNDSDTKLKFTQVTKPFVLSQQGSSLTNILVTYADYPAINDIDGDGDYDILTFWGLGSFLELHRNTSFERFGNADSLTFEKQSSCWGHFAEGNENNSIILDTCAESKTKLLKDLVSDDPKHTGSSILVNDLNADGLPDVTIGDVDFNTLIHLTNGGTLADARMISQTSDFPDAADPVNLCTFPAAMLADVNNDGNKDLLVSPFDPSLVKGQNFESVSLYINSGTNQQPDYSFVTKSFLQEQMLDLGSGAYPVFFDYNADGLMDILVGNYGYSDTCIYTPAAGLQCTFTAQLALLLNTGTATKPAFKLADRNLANLGALQMQSLIPALADMDGDGDADMVCGNSKGKLVFCENIALPGQSADFKLVDPAWQNIDVGDFSAPQLLDIDKDGLIDLVCGKRDGTINYYKNTGTAGEAQFELVNAELGGVDVTNTQLSNYGYVVPCFYSDIYGETLLLAASEFGDIFVYNQITNNLNGNFRLLGSLPGIKEGWRAGVAIGNMNNDTLTDMLIGNYSGGLGLFFGKPDKIFGIAEHLSGKEISIAITPNPASSMVSVSSSIQFNSRSEISLLSIDGRLIRKYPKTELPFKLDASELVNGVYFIRICVPGRILTGKLVVCH